MEMTSKERMIATMLREDVDRAPVPQGFWTLEPEEEAFSWDSLEEEIAWMKKFGFDACLKTPGLGKENPDIRERHWRENVPDEKYPLICKEWSSSNGTLTAKLRLTDDYPYGDDINMFHDYNTSRFIKPLLSNGRDLKTFVKMDPFGYWGTKSGKEHVEEWRTKCQHLRKIADQEGIAISCGGGTALNYLIQGSTAEQAIMLLMEYPDETMELMNTERSQEENENGKTGN